MSETTATRPTAHANAIIWAVAMGISVVLGTAGLWAACGSIGAAFAYEPRLTSLYCVMALATGALFARSFTSDEFGRSHMAMSLGAGTLWVATITLYCAANGVAKMMH